ncbi:hypothetical protein BH09GEM1_BH09GEM1_07330 [soil metagenome]
MTNWSDRLRTALCSQASAYAKEAGVASYESRGRQPVTLFPGGGDNTAHGNFQDESYAAIVGNSVWRARLGKSHPQRKDSLPAPYDTTAKELDSCTSSDALLMNIFCYPGVVAGEIARLLGVPAGTSPLFGVAGHVPLTNGKADTTEVDMQVGITNVEAKLTESSFTRGTANNLDRYARLAEVFDVQLLPRDGDDFLSYQLIRNVLAIAPRSDARFVVLLDARRPDLMHEWWTIHGAVHTGQLRARCNFVTWQELAAAAPAKLRSFLSLKYGL